MYKESFEIFPNELDIADTDKTTSTTVNQLPLIGNVQNIPVGLESNLIGQQAEVSLISTSQNTVSTPTLLNKTTYLKVVNINEKQNQESLLKYIISGRLTRPSTVTMVRS
jgi:hypothetical protein